MMPYIIIFHCLRSLMTYVHVMYTRALYTSRISYCSIFSFSNNNPLVVQWISFTYNLQKKRFLFIWMSRNDISIRGDLTIINQLRSSLEVYPNMTICNRASVTSRNRARLKHHRSWVRSFFKPPLFVLPTATYKKHFPLTWMMKNITSTERGTPDHQIWIYNLFCCTVTEDVAVTVQYIVL